MLIKIKTWNRTEKVMVVVTLILLVVLVAKSLIFDPTMGNTPGEKQFVQELNAQLATEKPGFFHRYYLVTDRIIKVSELTAKEIEALKKEGITSGTPYKAKMRTYFLGIIPFSEHQRVLKQ